MPEYSETKNTEKHEQRPFLAWFTAASIMLLLALAIIMRLPISSADMEVPSRQELSRRSSFDLKNTDPLSYIGMGTYLVRLEEGNVIFMDVLGQVRQTYEIPFREAEISSSAGNLFIKSALSSNLLMFRPQGESIVIESGSSVENIRASEERFLLLQKTGENLGELKAYDKAQSQPLLTLSFYESGYPLDMTFHEDGKGFDLVLLNLGQAQPRVFVHRYNEQGAKIADMLLPSKKILPAISLLSDDCTVLFNDETIMLVNLVDDEVIYEASFEKIRDLALALNHMAVLVDDSDELSLKLLRDSEASFAFEHLDTFSKADGDPILVNSRENIFLAQDNVIRAYDFTSGKFLAETELSETVMNLIAQDNNTLIVLTEGNGYLYSLDD